MANVSNYYVNKKEDLFGNKDSIIQGEKYRFTLLSERLVRMEYSPSGVFEDRPTSLVVNRKFPKVEFSIVESGTLIQISTALFTITYAKNTPFKASTFGSNIKVTMNGTDKEWQAGNPEVRNYRGINYSIDSVKDKIILDKGLYSEDGFCLIDDSKSLVLDENDLFVQRTNNETDFYLFLYNKDFDGCLSDYFSLTGYPSLIPRYALGAWWYKNDNYSEEGVLNLINKFKEENIPLSIFLLGDYWHNNINNYTPSINLQIINNILAKENIKLGVTVNPKLEIKKGSNDYNAISSYYSADKLKFIPLSNEILSLYLNLFITNLENMGVSVFSLDYNNPLDRLTSWKFSHYHKGKFEIKNQRGLVLSRNSGIASHRYPVVFSGKTKVNWTTLNLLPRYNSGGYNIGISFIAHPIGGYRGGIEEDELYLRYIQFATFSPIFLFASDRGEYYKREPWKWNPIIQKNIIYYINLRYKLIPYLYSESYDYHKTGHGIIKPFYYDYPKIYDEPLYKNQYFFGRHFFVAPITKKKNMVMNRVMQKVFVPNGIWFDFLQGKKFVGGKNYTNFYRDEDYPVFVKAGSIIPMQINPKEDIPTKLELWIYPLDNGTYELYEDDGITNNYKNGIYMITQFDYTYEEDKYYFTFRKKDGKNLLSNRDYILRFKNIKNISSVDVSNKSIKINCYYDKNDFVVELFNAIVGTEIKVSIGGKNSLVSSVRVVNEEIKDILYDLPIETTLKEKLDSILFSDLEVKSKRIKIRKLKRKGLDSKYIKIFINLLEYIQKA